MIHWLPPAATYLVLRAQWSVFDVLLLRCVRIVIVDHKVKDREVWRGKEDLQSRKKIYSLERRSTVWRDLSLQSLQRQHGKQNVDDKWLSRRGSFGFLGSTSLNRRRSLVINLMKKVNEWIEKYKECCSEYNYHQEDEEYTTAEEYNATSLFQHPCVLSSTFCVLRLLLRLRVSRRSYF